MKKTQSTRFLGLCLTALAIVVFSGCTSQTATAPTESPVATATNPQELKQVRVQLAFLMQSLDAPLIVAINKGYFTEEGLNVTYERGFGNADTISKLGTGKFDIGFSDMYDALEFNDKNPNDRIMAVSVIHNKAPFAILTLKQNGINSPQDLAGKRLGAPAGDGPRKLFPLFAKEVGIDPNSIQWTSMEPKLRESFLLQGKVDAISGFVTSALPSLLKGGKTLNYLNIFYYTDNGIDFYGNAILAKASFIEQNPEVMRSFVKAHMRGVQDVLKDPEAGLDAVIAADQSKLMDRNTEKVRLQIALERMIVTPEVEQLGLGAVDPKRLERTVQQTTEGLGLKGKPTVADIYTDQFLPPLAERQLPTASERKPLN